MPKPLLNNCCLCQSTRNGSVISGILAIVLSIITIVVICVTRVHFKTILFDYFSNDIVKIILIINLCMTILISLLMIAGVLKVSNSRSSPLWTLLNQSLLAAQPVSDGALGGAGNYDCHRPADLRHLHGRRLLHRRICADGRPLANLRFTLLR